VIKLAAVLLVVLAVVGLTFVWMAELLVSGSDGFEPPPLENPATEGFTMLTANVGNADPRCAFQLLKLCRSDTEARLTANLAKLRPEVAVLQEILPDHLCEIAPLIDPGHVCVRQYSEPQVRRLLGPDYSIVCEESNLIECIGIRTDVGEIEGCQLGELCATDRVVSIPDGCRTHLTIFAATATVHGKTFDIVNAHPENRSAECRLDSLQQVFEGDLTRTEEALILGDLNLDPWLGDDVSTEYWNTQVGFAETHDYYYHSGPDELEPPYPTVRYPFFVRTLDHVASNFLEGTMVTLGEAPGTLRLDGGRGTDHRAIYGWLSFPDS
jgi:hypothetical protein